MSIFDHFPFSTMHELNLDWIISKLKDVDKVKEAVDNVEENVSKAEQYAEQSRVDAESANNNATIANLRANAAGLSEANARGYASECNDILEFIQQLSQSNLSLLWQNASPSSGLGSSNVTLPRDSKNCFAFLVVARYNSQSSHISAGLIFRDVKMGYVAFPVVKIGSVVYENCGRGFRLEEYDSYDTMRWWTPYKNGVETVVTDVVPYKIYGLVRGDL